MCYTIITKGKEKEINKKMYFFQLVTLEPICGFHKYYYFMATGGRCPRFIKLDSNYPDKLRLLVEDREETPLTLECIDFFTYLYRKYIKKCFLWGERVNWEKEEL
jgi:hypothetical protein